MKKTRVLSFLLSVLMLLTVLAVFPVVTSAEDVAHDIATAPTTLPDGTRFLAVITDVHPDGRLILTDAATGIATPFYFKEVAFASIPASRP